MLLEHNFRSLKKLIRKWLHAREREFDIWDISAEVYEVFFSSFRMASLRKFRKKRIKFLKPKSLKRPLSIILVLESMERLAIHSTDIELQVD